MTRKFKQSQKLLYNQRRERQLDITAAVSQVVSSMFSNDKESAGMLLPSFEDAIKQVKDEVKGVSNGFIQGEWWKK